MGPGPPEFQRTFPLRKPIAGDDRRVSWNFLFIFSCLAFLCIFFLPSSLSPPFSFSCILFFGHHLSWSFSWNCTPHVYTAKIQYRQFETNIPRKGTARLQSQLGCALTFASEAKFEIEAKISFRLEAKKCLISHDSLRCETPKIWSENEGKISEN